MSQATSPTPETFNADEPFGAETDLIKKIIIITDNLDKNEYAFRLPTIADEVKIGTRMRQLRRKIDPNDDGVGVLDADTTAYLRAMAYFEILLDSSSAAWPYSQLSDGKRIVDSLAFPPDKANQALYIAGTLFNQVQRFRFGGAPPGGAAS